MPFPVSGPLRKLARSHSLSCQPPILSPPFAGPWKTAIEESPATGARPGWRASGGIVLSQPPLGRRSWSGVGTRVPIHWSPWDKADPGVPTETLLVARNGKRGPDLRGVLSGQHSNVLVLVDRFSKAASKLVALPGLPSAKRTAELLMQHVVRVHGMPSDLVSDRGPQFTSRYWKAFCELMGASVSLSSGFHPQSNGQTERVNQDLGQTLRCLVADTPSSWARHLPWAEEYAHNTLWHSSLGMSPFECQFGYPPPIFPEQGTHGWGCGQPEQYVPAGCGGAGKPGARPGQP
ncbi:hypothetical protein NFI96_007388 [Prochilodus magdalenae]|nr:hypothetical protein NFI96_007388 [Prochilodus magdalenae]